jgi:hypothetical protein
MQQTDRMKTIAANAQPHFEVFAKQRLKVHITTGYLTLHPYTMAPVLHDK